MPTMSSSAGSSVFEKVIPNKIFAVDKFNNVDKTHNFSIGQLTNPLSLSYTSDIDHVVRVLRDPAIAQYQDRLLKTAVSDINADKVDVDHIRIGLLLTVNDFAALQNEKTGITKVKTKARQKRLTIAPQGLGTINRGFKKEDVRPFITKKYRMYIDHDKYRFMDIYLGEPGHSKNKRELIYNCILEFIPTRLSLDHISLMLFHFKSTLRPGRYDQLVKLGLLLRIDTGYIMHGVSQLCALTLHRKRSAGYCIPLSNAVVETTYIGDKEYKPVVAYDKVLKENKFFFERVFRHIPVHYESVAAKIPDIDKWFTNQAASFRIEARDYMSKTMFSLSDIDTVSSHLAGVSFIKPSIFLNLPKKQIRKLLVDRRIEEIKNLREKLDIVHASKSKKYLIKFNSVKVQNAFSQLLQRLKRVIFDPSKSTDFPALNNYSQSLIEVRKSLNPFVKASLEEHTNVDDIINAKSNAIYVEGCPGAGKTDLIVKRIRALIETGESPESIVVVAFTRAASREFKRRLKEENLLSDGMFVGTFSAWCRSRLLENPDWIIISSKIQIEVVKSFLPKTGKIVSKFEPTELAQKIINIMSHAANFDKVDYAKSIGAIAPQLSAEIEKIVNVISKYQQWKNRNEHLDYDDLLINARASIVCQKTAKQKAKYMSHIIMDEIQDTNKVQWDILEAMFKAGSSLFCVGDPAQSIFGFRGADSKELNKFEKKFKNSTRFSVAKNYRSAIAIVDLANQVRLKINRSYRLSVPTIQEQGTIEYRNEETLKSAIDWLVENITRGSSSDSKCLVLCRYQSQLKEVKGALDKFESTRKFQGKVLTYHEAKGIEADHVYVLDPLFSNSILGSIKEELCNTYVAFTRAKKHLTIIASLQGEGLYGTKDRKKTMKSIFAELADMITD